MRNAEVIRQWKILRAVESARAGITIHQLARETNVTTRTIRRDLQALQEAGFAIFDEGEENETKRWKLDTQPFRSVQEGLSVSDVAALYLSRSIVEALSGWPLVDELGKALAKIERSLNPRILEFLSTLPQVVSTKAGPRAGQTATERLAPITRKLFDAVRDRRLVTMGYFSARSNRAKNYTVEPYRIALANDGVYLVAFVPAYDEFRTFAVERIQKLSVADETFRKTRELPADLFATSMGVFWGEPETVVIEFAARLAPYAQGRLWHPSQETDVLADGRTKVTLHVSNDWALRSWILSFGSGVKVLAPKKLADEIRKEHEAALNPT
ncbi:MAG: transcriptional regulator [Acidobacteria bacterium]|nr:MAG: transcriptional regulator [Acidobacteriota bacterium]